MKKKSHWNVTEYLKRKHIITHLKGEEILHVEIIVYK